MARVAKRERSIFFTMLIPMLLLVLGEVIIFASIFIGSGAIARLTQDNRDILDQQVTTRRDSLQNYFVGTVGNLESLSGEINAIVQSMLDAGELDMDLLDSSTKESNKLLEPVTDSLISTLRLKQVTGAYIVLNTHDLSSLHEGGAYGKKQGVLVRDMHPAAAPSARDEDLSFERASTDLVQSHGITTGSLWKPQFDFTASENEDYYDFFYLPWQTAYEAEGKKEASDYAYWSVAPYVGAGTGETCVTYSVPLILDDGTVYGVVGVDLSNDYLADLMPHNELMRGEGASYLLVTYDDPELSNDPEVMDVRTAVASGAESVPGALDGSILHFERFTRGEYHFQSEKGEYHCGTQLFKLYSSNTPFEYKRWALVGTLPEASLNRYVDGLRLMIAIASLAMLALGIIGSVLSARSVAGPIKDLSAEVSGAQLKNAEMPELAKTGISEVDQLTGAISTLSNDIASVRRLEQQRIEHERDYDLLTGLMNRRALYREASKLFATPSLVKHAALVMLDLDNLKDLNDTYGHDWGDKYIYQAARCFEEAVPTDVMVVRVSGDEFFLLFYGFDTREEIEQWIWKLRDAIPQCEVVLPGGGTAVLSASGGVAFYPEDSTEFTELMKLSDFAMYQTKLAGKNDIGFFDMSTYLEQSTVRRALDELSEIIKDSEKIDYHFQPIFDLREGSVFAYEALMRVTLENLRSPIDVVTLARQEGRMTEVERVTWERSFACFSALREGGSVSKGAYLFINSFANVSLPLEEYVRLSSRYPSMMSHTVIEITEAENMEEDATSTKRAIPGFSGFFALDDYGSGYNSEIMLIDLKPKFVKVDITIVRDIDTSIDRQRIMSNIVEYAHERNMFIVAEGVETENELACCIKLNVDLAQGFFLSRPSSVPGDLSDEARAVIEAHAD